jgi:hypothetical protein
MLVLKIRLLTFSQKVLGTSKLKKFRKMFYVLELDLSLKGSVEKIQVQLVRFPFVIGVFSQG